MKFASKVAGLYGAILLAHSFIRALFGGGFGIITLILILFGVIGIIFFVAVSLSELMEAMKRRTTRYGGNLLLISLLALGIVFLLNFISFKNNKRFDLTEEKVFTLQEQTVKLIKGLDKTLKVLAFFEPESKDKSDFKDLIDLYRAKSKKIEVEFIDPDRQPLVTRQYNVTRYGTVILEYGENKKEITETIDEEILTNAIISVTRSRKKVIYTLEGHGEKDIDDIGERGYSELKSLLEKQNYEIKKLSLLRTGKVPDDADMLMVCGPQKALLPVEIEAIDSYIKAAGSVILLLDPMIDTGLEEMTKKYGIDVGDDVVIEPNPVFQIFGGDYGIPVVSSYGIHDITRDFKLSTIFPLVRSVRRMEEDIVDTDVEELAKTSSDSWAERDMEKLKAGVAEMTEDVDIKGPVGVAVISSIKHRKGGEGEEETGKDKVKDEDKGEGEKGKEETESGQRVTPKEEEGHLIVFGDSDFITNTYLYQMGNSDLFLNCVNYSAKEEGLIGIAKREKKQGRIDITQEGSKTLFFFSVELLPLILLLGGATAWLKKRNQ